MGSLIYGTKKLEIYPCPMASSKDRTRLIAFQKDEVVAAWKMGVEREGVSLETVAGQ